MATKKFFWMKLSKDFFKTETISYIKEQKKGEALILFYLNLCLESLDSEGKLIRKIGKNKIAFDEKSLAKLTDTEIDVVKQGIKLFDEIGLIERLDDGTIYIPSVKEMIGSESKWAEKKRHYRGQSEDNVLDDEEEIEGQSSGQDVGQSEDNVPKMSDKSIEYRDKSKRNTSINTSIKKKEDILIHTPKPVKSKTEKHKHGKYQHVLLTDEELVNLQSKLGNDAVNECITFLDQYIEMKDYKVKSHYLAILNWVVDAVNERKAKKKRIVETTPNYSSLPQNTTPLDENEKKELINFLENLEDKND